MSEWKPIETAPKDGTKILACNAQSGEIAVVHWDYVSMGPDSKGWQISVVCTDWNYYEYLSGATHWMPKPELPSDERSAGSIFDAYRIAGELFARLDSTLGFGTLTMSQDGNVVSYRWEFNVGRSATETSRKCFSVWSIPLYRFKSLRPLDLEALEISELWKNAYRRATQ